MRALSLIPMFLLCATLMGGCVGSSGKTQSPSPSPTPTEPEHGDMYVVATDTGSPFSEGIYKLRPATYSFKQGTHVMMTLKNAVGNFNEHNLVLQGYDLTIPAIKQGEAKSVTFNATKSGTFAYYCSIGNHRALGMEGKLTIA
jgi:plastocyanin